MKFKDWITYEFPSDEIIQGGSNIKYVERSGFIEGDIPQPHLIGVAPQSDLIVLINYLATFNFQNINQKLCHHGHIRHRPPHSQGLRRRIEAMQNIFKYNFVTFEGEPSLQNIVTFSEYIKFFCNINLFFQQREMALIVIDTMRFFYVKVFLFFKNLMSNIVRKDGVRHAT